MTSIRPFLMFHGQAEEALRFYVSLFPNSKIFDVVRYGPDEAGAEGTVKTAQFQIAGQSLMCTDSGTAHGFTFTPSFSLFVECDSEEQIRHAFASLLQGGTQLMPLGDYGFSQQFGWLNDRYGVSWQLCLR
jgi:predicted 3-demethylubiquinone-9 3-methyltransferase (glyoxalase superfamily)